MQGYAGSVLSCEKAAWHWWFSPAPLGQRVQPKPQQGNPGKSFLLTQDGGKDFPAIKKESVGEHLSTPGSGSQCQEPAQ